jgi:RNA polymerase sigma-70 factor (ECF subfamily)
MVQLPDRRPGPEDVVQRREVVALVHAALAALSPEHRQVVVLRDLYGRTGAETARRLGLSLPAMKSRLHRARDALRAEVIRRSTGDPREDGDRAAPVKDAPPRQRLAEN